MDVKNILKEDILEQVYIRDYDKFVMVEDRFYGGHQEWLYTQGHTSKFWADRSCGVVAAANVSYYLFKSVNIEAFYRYPSKSKTDYSSHINDIYKFIKPFFYGVPTISKMARGFTKYAKSRDVDVRPVYLNLDWNLNNIIDYIKMGLSDNNPVMMLTWNTKVKNLKYHWVTITGYIKTKSNKHYVVTSNWGRMEVFSLDDWVKKYSVYKGSIYFEVINCR